MATHRAGGDSLKLSGFHRLQALRMENDAKGFEMDEMRPRFERIGNRHEDGTAPRAVSAYQLFQTPVELAERLVALLGNLEGKRVLEPSAGLGRLLDALQPRQTGEVVAVEVSPDLCGELFRQQRSGVALKQRDFLTVQPEELGLFDAVAMNPPFHMRSDIQHIEHALRFLKPGGMLAALCMNTEHRVKAFGHRATSWEVIPAGTFKQEGTNTETVLFTLTA